jgi:hypothetical protein
MTVYIVDDFLPNPNEVREFALTLEYPLRGPFPGFRTRSPDPEWGDSHQSKFESILGTRILQWPKREWSKGAGNTLFHIASEGWDTSIHTDESEWAGVLYLTPSPPPNSGTTIWSNNFTGAWNSNMHYHPIEEMSQKENWSEYQSFENRYNRLVLYPSHVYHSATKGGFGTNTSTSRLTQVFFFTTSKVIWQE